MKFSHEGYDVVMSMLIYCYNLAKESADGKFNGYSKEEIREGLSELDTIGSY